MKKVLGLDLGTTSIGWALVNESDTNNEKSEIIKLGVRVNPLTIDEQTDFEKGRPLSVNADRTLKRGARRNLQRYKQRRKNLVEILTKNGFISNNILLTEIGKNTTHQTLALRAKSAKQQIRREEFSRVLLTINKKRGYKSSRKAKNEEEGSLIDGMAIAKELYDSNLTVGQYVFQLLESGGKYIPDFYLSDLQNEFNAVWEFQKQFYSEKLTDKLYNDLQGKGKQQTWAICKEPFSIVGEKRITKRVELKKENYKWRAEGLTEKLTLEQLAIVLQEINNNLNNSSGYLGAISDRSKELYFNKETVGENLYKQIQENAHTSLKNQVFYRQDYLDEFEQIWETQTKYYSELTTKLKEEIRDIVIFYQRKLKSQKHLISNCEFEKYHKSIPKSSPLFQEFKIWQNLNNLEIKHIETKEKQKLDDDARNLLFEELNLRGNLKASIILKLLKLDAKKWSLNFKEIEGNRTNEALYNVYQKIADFEGYGFDWSKKIASKIKEELYTIFPEIGISTKILGFNSELSGNDFDKQESYQLWHLLYSEEDNKTLKQNLYKKYGFRPEYTSMLTNVSLQQDYGRLSAKAIKKVIPFLISGNNYSESCALAKYNHSHSLTKEELETRPLKDKLELLQKNSLRNPVVEKILNQMVNVINQVIETYGKPDEVRIELARDLKKSAKERAETTKYINTATNANIEFKKIITKVFGIPNPTKNDLIKYKLYEELKDRGYKTLFTNQYIKKEDLFSKNIDIEHIIPKSKLFDDSFSNKTLAFRKVNLAKADRTALDFIESDYNADLDNYKKSIDALYNKGKGAISKGKYKKLLMAEKDLPDGFIDRDLRNSQYIAKKAKQLLQETIRTVNTTTGSITSKLREDWDLINVMKELNLPKYRKLGLTEIQERKNNKKFEIIKDWTKRNDHRHHAMDALTVAFTTYNHVQYLNNLNASRDSENSKLYGIRTKITKVYEYKNGNKKRKFIPPMSNFREKSKKEIESILISFKTKNKVVTRNINKTKQKGKDKYNTKIQLTPRGQLHKETIYGKMKEIVVKEEKIGGKFDELKINQITKSIYKDALLKRLADNENNPKKAFTGKNALSKNPIYINKSKTKEVPEVVKIKFFENNYTIRKDINSDQFKDFKSLQKIIDVGVRRILENRLTEFNNDAKKAFSDLDKNPIWLNKEKGISIKRVTISGVKNVEALHTKKDHFGKEVLDKDGKTQAVDFVSTGNNHHVAIYKDKDGKLCDNVVSFYEALARINAGLPIIDKEYNGWQFLFTMKQNEMFVFPSDNFNPKEIDLEENKNINIISKHLFRVQKFSKVEYGNSAVRDYVFRHHLETQINNKKELRNKSFIISKSLLLFNNILKVRINHIGKIVQVGEY